MLAHARWRDCCNLTTRYRFVLKIIFKPTLIPETGKHGSSSPFPPGGPPPITSKCYTVREHDPIGFIKPPPSHLTLAPGQLLSRAESPLSRPKHGCQHVMDRRTHQTRPENGLSTAAHLMLMPQTCEATSIRLDESADWLVGQGPCLRCP